MIGRVEFQILKQATRHFDFESHIAEEVFKEMLKEAKVRVVFEEYVDVVRKKAEAIQEIVLSSGLKVRGKVFIDATYEGDLMARSGVSYTYGRESKDTYGESYAGIRFMDDTLSARTVDSQGRMLPYFSKNTGLKAEAGDKLVMNYNFRPTLTKVESNKVEISKPIDYDSSRFELLGDFLKNYPKHKTWPIVRYLSKR